MTRDNMVIGIGSGSTVVYAVERLLQLQQQHKWSNLVCIPTSFQSEQLITAVHAGNAYKLTLGRLDASVSVIDVTIDGADEVDSELNCIKGGGACQLQEKIVANNSKLFVVIADYRKHSALLGQQWRAGIPIEVIPMAYTAVINKLKLMPQCATAVLRMAHSSSKAGPVISDNGNVIVDADFGSIAVADVAAVNNSIQRIAGVVETGLFVQMASKAYFGYADGTVKSSVNSKADAQNMQ